jgi:hypothetical protein
MSQILTVTFKQRATLKTAYLLLNKLFFAPSPIQGYD